MPADLQMSVLLGIMQRMRELRDSYPQLINWRDFLDLVSGVSQLEGEQKAFHYLDRHVTYLKNEGYLATVDSGAGIVRLTNQGEKFVQPELADFGKEPLLPKIVQSIEDRIAILTYPQEEKDGMRFRLREAITTQAPDFAAKVLAEIAYKAFTG
jgi:hypothetical protein